MGDRIDGDGDLQMRGPQTAETARIAALPSVMRTQWTAQNRQAAIQGVRHLAEPSTIRQDRVDPLFGQDGIEVLSVDADAFADLVPEA